MASNEVDRGMGAIKLNRRAALKFALTGAASAGLRGVGMPNQEIDDFFSGIFDPRQRLIKVSPISQSDHALFHRPDIEGVVPDPIPYLAAPLDSHTPLKITEGWGYGLFERSVHRAKVHAGLDLELPYGTNIYAPCEGFAMSTYQYAPLTNGDGNLILYEGKDISLTLGLFVQIYNPRANRFVQLAHLSRVMVPFSEPAVGYDQKNGIVTLSPRNHTVKIADMPAHPKFSWVETGQKIGESGVSGLYWGYLQGYRDFLDNLPGPTVTADPNKQRSWDEWHLHWWERYRSQVTGTVGWQRDMLDLYGGEGEQYMGPKNSIFIGPEPLIHTEKNRLVFAR